MRWKDGARGERMASATKINCNRNGAQGFYMLHHKNLRFGIQLSQTCIFYLLSSPQSAAKMEGPQCNLQVESPIGQAAAQPQRVLCHPSRACPWCPTAPCSAGGPATTRTSCRGKQFPALFKSTEVAGVMLRKSKHSLAWHNQNKVWSHASFFPSARVCSGAILLWRAGCKKPLQSFPLLTFYVRFM